MRTSRYVLLFLLTCAGIIYIQRVYTIEEPLECDTALFSVLANEWNHGKHLYTEIWDNKPPGIILSYALAQKLTSFGQNSILLLETVTAILTLFGIFAATYWMTGDSRAGSWAALIWTLINATPYLECNQPLSEVFINALWVWGIAFLFRFMKDNSISFLWLAGAFFSAASLYKHYVVLASLIIIVSYAC